MQESGVLVDEFSSEPGSSCANSCSTSIRSHSTSVLEFLGLQNLLEESDYSNLTTKLKLSMTKKYQPTLILLTDKQLS